MILIYAYIKKFKNYIAQEICFDNAYRVIFSEGNLSITFLGQPSEPRRIRNGKKPDNLHLLVGKTGSGKTNLLQLIGAKYDTRSHRKWDGEDDAYFLLYKMNETEFFLEICDVAINQFPEEKRREDKTIPESIRENARRMSTLRTVRFLSQGPVEAGKTITAFTQVAEYGYGKGHPDGKARERAMIMNCYDPNAFIKPPYVQDKETYEDFSRSSWIGRAVMPYSRTSLWQVCDYIRDYIMKVEPGSTKRQVSFVLSTHNFAEQYPLKLPKAVEREYWTFYEIRQDEMRAAYDDEARKRLGRRKKKKNLSNKQMFIHDLWADYAKYLRKWAEKIRNYTEKEYDEDIIASQLPDGEKISIVKRCLWLAEYIDRKDRGDPHGLLWQIVDDIKDIGNFLAGLEDKYFTVDTCTIPVVDMVQPQYKRLFEDLFERMEQYTPDDAGIFTECLLPYEFTRLSTGEYQYAKVLGGMEDYLKIVDRGRGQSRKPDKIILLDEPEAYMHPELARQFIARMYEIMGKYTDSSAVQVIISTHSPFMMSDVFPEEVTRLDIHKDTGNAIVKNGSAKEYFGANIHTILADSFFLDYTIGEYSRVILEETYKRLDSYLKRAGEMSEEDKQFMVFVRELTPHIGDRMIRRAFEIGLSRLG